MSSSRNNAASGGSVRPRRGNSLPQAVLPVAILALALLAGCIADTPEDSDLPWSSNKGWEGMIPLPVGAMNQYD